MSAPKGAYVSASRSRPIKRSGMTLDVRLPHHSPSSPTASDTRVTTTAITIRGALAEAGVTLRAHDRITPSLQTRPSDDQVIAVTRVRRQAGRAGVADQVHTVQRESKDLYKGTTKVLKRGKVGILVKTYQLTYLDKRLADRRKIDEAIAKQPVTQVVLVGTKKLPENAPAADGLNWAALAKCESGGNPQAYNPAGPYYGLYQFMPSTWHAVGGVGLPTDASAGRADLPRADPLPAQRCAASGRSAAATSSR